MVQEQGMYIPALEPQFMVKKTILYAYKIEQKSVTLALTHRLLSGFKKGDSKGCLWAL